MPASRPDEQEHTVTQPQDPYAAQPQPEGNVPGSMPPAQGYPQPGYAAPPAYGQPPGYGQPLYGYPTPPYGQLPYGPPAILANWLQRVGAFLIDALVVGGPGIVLFIVGAVVSENNPGVAGVLVLLAYATSIGLTAWNLVRQGRTGQTLGKQQLGLRLVREADGQNVGAGLSIGRHFVHIVDGLACYLGYLWPLWDAKRQTFADKILSTLVIKV